MRIFSSPPVFRCRWLLNFSTLHWSVSDVVAIHSAKSEYTWIVAQWRTHFFFLWPPIALTQKNSTQNCHTFLFFVFAFMQFAVSYVRAQSKFASLISNCVCSSSSALSFGYVAFIIRHSPKCEIQIDNVLLALCRVIFFFFCSSSLDTI